MRVGAGVEDFFPNHPNAHPCCHVRMRCYHGQNVGLDIRLDDYTWFDAGMRQLAKINTSIRFPPVAESFWSIGGSDLGSTQQAAGYLHNSVYQIHCSRHYAGFRPVPAGPITVLFATDCTVRSNHQRKTNSARQCVHSARALGLLRLKLTSQV
jgi:hypothetical protein